MLEVTRFILNYTIKFISMLFTIDVGNGFNLGLMLCLAFIMLPLVLRVVSFLKRDAMEELNDRYDESRPVESFSSTERQWVRSPGSTRDYGRTFITHHTRTRRRRYKI